MKVKIQSQHSVLIGAACLMATSAIGPGFLTQTTFFTEQLLASFGFVIFISILIDIAAQMNIWRIVTVSELRAQDIANKVFPGLGIFLAILIVMGGLAFNIGNVGGAGLGMNILMPNVNPLLGGLISGLIAIAIFLMKEAGAIMDRFAQAMGFIMIALMAYVMFTASPPLAEAAYRTVVPEQINYFAIITLVGGTVGGYITFAGAHRLLEAGIKGKAHIKQVDKSAMMAISLASLMRIFLFLTTLGVVSQGFKLDPSNPSASVFQLAAGNIGYKIFGVIMWAAALTSIIGAAYTSVSFMRSLHPLIEKYNRYFIIGFIAISTSVFTLLAKPVIILLLVGSVNGLILPIALTVMLIAAHKKSIVKDYKHPLWMTLIGIFVIISMSIFGVLGLVSGIEKLMA